MSEPRQDIEAVFMAEGLEPGVASVRSCSISERLSSPLVAEVEIELPEVAVDPASWIRGPAELVLVRPADGEVFRRVSGVVTRVREKARTGPEQRIVVTFESPLALLQLFSDHRIFQQMTTKDIVSTLLEDAQVPSDAYEWRLSNTYPVREVCTQYAETSFELLHRLLEEDGIFYFDHHDGDASKIVFTDSSAAYEPCAPTSEIVMSTSAGLAGAESFEEIEELERLRPAKVTLRDHDFKRPALDLEAEAESDAPLGREHYEHPGRYVEPDEGARRAALVLDSMVAEATGVRVHGYAPSLAAGHTLTLSGSRAAAFDRKWVVERVTHAWSGSADGASSSTEARLLPDDLVFRAPRMAPHPAVPGPQIARVTTPPGEEIHCDEHGRIKVRFPWDRRAAADDSSSAWVRVGQMHTSGSVAIPRHGWELLVDFEYGDPDRPLVLGRLYNAQLAPPYALPGNKATTTFQSASSPGMEGHHEIRMKDDAGSEHIHIHAEKDQNIQVAGDSTLDVATTSSTNIGSAHTVDIGGNDTLTVAANRNLIVKADQSRTIGGSRTETVTGAESHSVNSSRARTIGGSHTVMTPMTDTTGTNGTFSETVGGSCIEAAALEVAHAVAGTATITVGGAKIEAVAAGKSDTTIGAKATTVGGAFVSATGADVGVGVKGAKATTVGGAFVMGAGGDVNISAKSSLRITVGGAVSMNGAKVVLQVGGSKVTIAGGGVKLKSSTIKLTASGPQPELAGAASDK